MPCADTPKGCGAGVDVGPAADVDAPTDEGRMIVLSIVS